MRKPSSASPRTATTKTPCCSKVGLKRGPWTPEEDELLANYINKEGEGHWRTLPKRAGLLRCGKSCRLRWMNYLRPSVKRGHIAPDEEDLILRLHRLLGNRWSLIAGRIPGRTDNEIKNYWNTHLSKKLISQGIDPRTHKPLDPNCSDPLKPSSNKPHRKSSPNWSSDRINHTTTFSSLTETTSSNGGNNINLPDGTCTLHDHLGHGFTGLLNCEDAGGVMRIGDEDINYGADDVFSSFLNSLINEEALLGHHQAPSDPLVSTSSTNFGPGINWEPPLVSSCFKQNNDPKMSNGHPK